MNKKGKQIETKINITNKYYSTNNIALVHKNEALFLPKYHHGKNVAGRYISTGLLDYIGSFNGYYCEFETKETSKDVYYYSRIPSHQLKRFKSLIDFNCLTFLILHFSKYQSCFLIYGEDVINNVKFDYYNPPTYAYKIPSEYSIPVNYVTILRIKSRGDSIGQ